MVFLPKKDSNLMLKRCMYCKGVHGYYKAGVSRDFQFPIYKYLDFLKISDSICPQCYPQAILAATLGKEFSDLVPFAA